jgi:ferredoxin
MNNKTNDSVIADILSREIESSNVISTAVKNCTDNSLTGVLRFALNRKQRRLNVSLTPVPLDSPKSSNTLQSLRKPIPRAVAPAAGGTSMVQFQPVNRQIPVAADTTLLAAAMTSGIPIRHDCGGHGQCGTCRVRVLNGGNNLTPHTPPEQKLLSNLLNQSWRLACQIRTGGAVTVDVPPVTK